VGYSALIHGSESISFPSNLLLFLTLPGSDRYVLSGELCWIGC